MKKNLCLFLWLITFASVSLASTETPATEKKIEPAIDISKIGKIDDEAQLYNKTTDTGEQFLTSVTKNSKSNSHSDYPIKKVYSGAKKTSENEQYFIVAKINSDVVTNVDIMNAIRFIFFSSGKPFDKTKASLMIRSILAREIYGKLQQQVAQRNKMKISESDVNRRVQEIAERNGVTVNELEKRFAALGISMPVFKTNIESRMLFSTIVETMKNDIEVTRQEINEEKKQAIEANKNTRYKLYEIHLRIEDAKNKAEVITTAQTIIKLIDEGFSFPVLAENISQGNYKLQIGDLGWVSEKNMEKSVKDAVTHLKIGQHTGIIETNSGLKIIMLEDKADSNKMGSSEAIYRYMKVSLQYKGALVTSKDAQKIENTIKDLKSAKTPQSFKKICAQYKLDIDEKEENISNPFMLEVIESSTLNANTMQSLEDDDYVDIYFTESKTVPDAKDPTDEEVEYTIISKKVSKLFQRSFKQAENVAFIVTDECNVDRLMKQGSR